MPQLDVFLLVLRILFIVLLYLFLMQVVIAITRDLKAKAPVLQAQLLVVDIGPSTQLAPGTRFELLPQTTIGRGPTNTIRLGDSFISSEHAHIWNRNGKWFVQDAGSTYGTFVNNQPARDPLLANLGDIIQIGPIRFKLIK
jgi:pSer/pThr/pTyr-binding forkhead associated (FHA) protein